MSLIIDGTNGVTFNDSSLQGAAASPYVLKNRIINGDMRIDQRNAGASVTSAQVTAAGAYFLDRWRVDTTTQSSFTYQQNAGAVTPPAGFTNYLGVTTASAYSPASNTTVRFGQAIEGYNVADLGWGTANAQTVTLSFWVRSSIAGTQSGSIVNSGGARSYVYSYTINAVNTWEYKTITITGDTSGTWLTTNGIGMLVGFNLGTGTGTYGTTTTGWQNGNLVGLTTAIQLSATNGATLYLTGVQLEIGTSATPFERRLYNQELANCQRYCQQWTGNGVSTQTIIASGFQISTTASIFNVQTAVPMRAAPTLTYSNLIVSNSIDFDATVSALSITNWASTSTYIQPIHSAAGAATRPVRLSPAAGTSGYINLSAEL